MARYPLPRGSMFGMKCEVCEAKLEELTFISSHESPYVKTALSGWGCCGAEKCIAELEKWRDLHKKAVIEGIEPGLFVCPVLAMPLQVPRSAGGTSQGYMTGLFRYAREGKEARVVVDATPAVVAALRAAAEQGKIVNGEIEMKTKYVALRTLVALNVGLVELLSPRTEDDLAVAVAIRKNPA